MLIRINGESREVPEHCTAQGLIDLLALGGRRLALEINHEIVPRTAYATHRLHAGDQVEIVHAIGGG